MAKTKLYSTHVDKMHTFYGAYCAYKEECALIDDEWGPGTQIKYDRIVKNKLPPHLPLHGRTPIRSYTLSDYLGTIKAIEKLGQNDDASDFVPYDEGTLAQYLVVLKTVVKVASQKEAFLNVFDNEPEDDREQEAERIRELKKLQTTPKSLTVSQEKKVSKYLLEHLSKRGEYIVLYLMYCLGLRNEEGCAVNFGHLFEFEQYPGHYYLTVPQSTHIHRNEAKLEVKTYNAYRNVPIPSQAAEVIMALQKQRLQAMQNVSGWKVPIKDMWIGYKGKNMFDRCGADNVTQQAKNMFEELGMRDTLRKVTKYLDQDMQAVGEEQEDVDEFALIEKEPTAYLLRRNFATHMAILQLTEAELTYVLGHVIVDPQVQRSDYTNERELYLLKQKMDKRPIVNDVGTVPKWVLDINSTIVFSGHCQEFILTGSQASKATVHATATEPGDSITVTVEQPAGVCSKETISLLGAPYPNRFPRNTDVLKAYYAAFQKEYDKSNSAI